MFFSNYCYHKFKLWRQLSILRILIILIFGISDSAVASPLNKYCISKVKATPSRLKFQDNLENKSSRALQQSIVIFKNGEKFTLEDNGLGVQLKRPKNNKIISQLNYFLEKDEWIKYLYLTKDNWLFINADKNNYITKINLDLAELRLERPSKLPIVYREKCSSFENWFVGGCSVSGLSYSPTLDSIFVTGYHPTSSGQEWVTMQVVAGKTKILLSPKTIESFRADIPQLEGVIFKGSSGEILFYDGLTVIELPIDFPKPVFWSKTPDWRIEGLSDIVYKYSTDIYNGRIFIGNLNTTITPKFLFELKAGLSTKPIPLPEELVQKMGISLDIAKLPNDFRIWAIMGNNILAEIEGEMKTVVTAPESYIIIAWGRSNSTISFQVAQKENPESNTTYYIKQVSPEAQCEAMLDPNKPLLLDGDKIIEKKKSNF
jgi:hypothetical protein